MNTSHIVMHRWEYRRRLLGHVDARENLRGLTNAGQSLVQQFRRNVVEVQMNVIFFGTTATALQNFDSHGSGDDVARGQVLGRGSVSFHEAFALKVIKAVENTSELVRKPPSPRQPSVMRQPEPYMPVG